MTQEQHVFVNALAGFLLAGGVAHILLPKQTNEALNRPATVRMIGGLLFLVAVPCFLWRGGYFLLLGILLAVSGAWRLFFPASSIRAQAGTYPRWVHGCLLLLGGFGVWGLSRISGQ
jgi:hypothetical protein